MGTTDTMTTTRSRRVASKVADAIAGAKVLDAVAAGASLEAAGKLAGVKIDVAQRLLHAEMRRFYEQNASQREELVGRELRKLDLLERRVFRDALNGDVKAVDRVLAIMKRRADMLGLDAAAKVQVEISAVDEALAEIVQIVEGKVVGAEVAPLRRAEAV
jgi:hypothetical protein